MFNLFRWFRDVITKLVVTFDDCYAIAGSGDGTILIFEIGQKTASKSICSIPPEFGKYEDIIIPRQHLIEKNLKIIDLEQTIETQLAESQYQEQEGDSSHSEELREAQTEYCAALEKLNQINSKNIATHQKRVDELLSIIEETKRDHAKTLQNFEKDFNDKFSAEYRERQNIQSNVLVMEKCYEQKLTDSTEMLQNTIENMEIDFKNQLQERQDLLRDLMQELDDKKSQFNLYCTKTKSDYEKKKIQLKTNYEQQIMELNEQLEKRQLENAIIERQLSNSRVNCDELEREKLLISQEHIKSQRSIQDVRNRLTELRDEIRDRDHVIHNKETQLNTCDKRNQELQKYKNVLNYKIDELNAAAEPCNHELGEKGLKIELLEDNLEDVVKYGMKLEFKVTVLNDKLEAFKIDVESERRRRRTADAVLKQIYRDIYIVSRKTIPNELKKGITELYYK